MGAEAVDEVVAEEDSVAEEAFAFSSLALAGQVVAQGGLLADLGPKIVSSAALDEDLAGAAGATQERGRGKAHFAAHTGLAAEAED